MTETTIKTTSPQLLWKANLLEFFHNYFIGISHLECSEEDCPIVDNWDSIEAKLSKEGLCALVAIAKTKKVFLVTKIADKKINGLEQLTEVTIEFRDGEKKLVRTEAERAEIIKKTPEWKRKGILFEKPENVAYFVNNSNFGENLLGCENYLDEMWEIKQDIIWDRDNSRKKIINWVEQKPDPMDKAAKVEQTKQDYIFYIHNPDITNEIKKYEVYQTQNTKEREQLWIDYEKLFGEIRRIYGIRHLTSKKEERQNNPEIELNEAQFIALERRKKRIREKCIKEAVQKGFCNGEHTLSYGTAPEQREEKIQELEEIKDLEENPEELEEIKEPGQRERRTGQDLKPKKIATWKGGASHPN